MHRQMHRHLQPLPSNLRWLHHSQVLRVLNHRALEKENFHPVRKIQVRQSNPRLSHRQVLHQQVYPQVHLLHLPSSQATHMDRIMPMLQPPPLLQVHHLRLFIHPLPPLPHLHLFTVRIQLHLIIHIPHNLSGSTLEDTPFIRHPSPHNMDLTPLHLPCHINQRQPQQPPPAPQARHRSVLK